MTELSNLEKIEWIHWLLDELDQGTAISSDNIRKAIDFIEDIRDSYHYDLK